MRTLDSAARILISKKKRARTKRPWILKLDVLSKTATTFLKGLGGILLEDLVLTAWVASGQTEN